jgi:hypothetical protein
MVRVVTELWPPELGLGPWLPPLLHSGIYWLPLLLALLVPFLLATSVGLWSARSELIPVAKMFHLACAAIWLFCMGASVVGYLYARSLQKGESLQKADLVPLLVSLSVGGLYVTLARAIGSLGFPKDEPSGSRIRSRRTTA